jgi:hypothetical protein
MLRRLYLVFLSLFVFAPFGIGQMVPLSGSHIQDLSGAPLKAGQICFSPVNNSGTPISYLAGGGGQVLPVTKCAPVTNGAFSLSVTDTAASSPANVCLNTVVVIPGSPQQRYTLSSCLQPSLTGTVSSGTWCTTSACNLDNYPPATAPGALVQSGPAGQAPTITTGTMTVGVNASDYSSTLVQTYADAFTRNYQWNVKFPLAPSATDTTKMPLAGGSFTGAVGGPVTAVFTPSANYTSPTIQNEAGVVGDGINLATVYANNFTGITNGFANGVVGAGVVPSGSTIYQYSGLAGIVQQNSTTTNAVGVFGLTNCLVSGAQCWGGNFVASDASAGSGDLLWITEFDVNIRNALTSGCGTCYIGVWSAQPTNFPAIYIQKPLGGTGTGYGWPAGVQFQTGALSGTGTAILMNPLASGNSQDSQRIAFTSTGASGQLQTAEVYGDVTGDLIFNTKGAGFAAVDALDDLETSNQLISLVATGTAPIIVTSTTPVANLEVANHPLVYFGSSTFLTPFAKVWAGSCLFASGTCTVAIPSGVFTAAPFCLKSEFNTAGSVGTAEPSIWIFALSSTSITLNSSSSTYAGTAHLACIGN